MMLLVTPICDRLLLLILVSSSPLMKRLFSCIIGQSTEKGQKFLHVDEIEPFFYFWQVPGLDWF